MNKNTKKFAVKALLVLLNEIQKELGLVDEAVHAVRWHLRHTFKMKFARDEREALLAQARTEVETANRNLEALRRNPAATPAQIQAAQDAVAEAHKKMAEATALGTAITNAGRRIDSWSAGSVSLAQEEADMKFAGALKKLRDEAREEAYKKSATAKAFKQQMERLQATEISEYREGWDEESFNEAVRDRISSEMTALNNAQRNRAAAQSARDAAEAALTAARATGNAAAIAAAQTDLTARETALLMQLI